MKSKLWKRLIAMLRLYPFHLPVLTIVYTVSMFHLIVTYDGLRSLLFIVIIQAIVLFPLCKIVTTALKKTKDESDH